MLARMGYKLGQTRHIDDFCPSESIKIIGIVQHAT